MKRTNVRRVLVFVSFFFLVPPAHAACIDWPKWIIQDTIQRLPKQSTLIVVQDFRDDTEVPGQAWLTDGIPQLLIEYFSSQPNVIAVPNHWVPHLTKRFRPRLFVGGLYQNRGDKLRVFVQLRSKPEGEIIAQFPTEFLYPGHTDFFVNLRKIAADTLSKLGVEPDPGKLDTVQNATRNVRAFENAARGSAILHSFDPDQMEAAIIWFQEAQKFDIRYESAYFGLADTFGFIGLHRKQKHKPFGVDLQKAESTLQKWKAIKKAEVVYTDRLGSRILAAQIHFLSALHAASQNHWAPATQELEQATKSTPYDAESLLTLAQGYDRLGKASKAAKARTRAKEINTCLD